MDVLQSFKYQVNVAEILMSEIEVNTIYLSLDELNDFPNLLLEFMNMILE